MSTFLHFLNIASSGLRAPESYANSQSISPHSTRVERGSGRRLVVEF